MATPKAKPLSFSTTIRTPERIPKFLKCVLPFEGMRLTSDVIHKIVKNLILEKEYTTLFIQRTPDLKQIKESFDDKFTMNSWNSLLKCRRKSTRKKALLTVGIPDSTLGTKC